MQKTDKNIEKMLQNIKNDENYRIFVNYLKSISKHESVNDLARHKAILNTNQAIIGISMKNVREIAKKISKVCLEDFLLVMRDRQPNESFYEETLIEGLIITEIKELDLQMDRLKYWMKKIDNWSTCDSVVTSLKILKKSLW